MARVLPCVLVLSLPAPALAQDDEQPPALDTPALVSQLLHALAASTGLTAKHEVRIHEENRGALADMFRRLIAHQYPGNRLDLMGQAFGLIRLLPPGHRLREEAVKVYQAQVSGYYDPYTQTLVLLRDSDPEQRVPILQHELTHALQDQNFNLAQMLDRAIVDEDRALALQGALEGQAVVAMFSGAPSDPAEDQRALKELAADGVLDKNDMAALSEMAKDSGSLSSLMQSAGAIDASAYLQAQLSFPYQEGTRFIEALMRKSSLANATHQTLARPPVSTKQVMYPQAYEAGEQPAMIGEVAPAHWRAVFSTTVGALNIRTLLGGASELPAHWSGDRVFLFERNGASAVAWVSLWESAAHAAAFAKAFSVIVGHDKRVLLQQQGRFVTFAGDLAEEDKPAFKAALENFR
jgi:hypothetical protein